MDSGGTVFDHPGLGRVLPVPSELELAQAARRGRYQLGRFEPTWTAGSNDRPKDTVIKIAGDHLSFLEVQGSDHLLVRIGDKSNPFLPFDEGMVFVRDFEQITFRVTHRQVPAMFTLDEGSWGRVVFAASYGELIKPWNKLYGLRRGFYAAKLTATVAGLDVTEGLVNALFLDPNRNRTILIRYGGTLMVRNLDPAKKLYLALWPFGVPVDLTRFWEVWPGEVHTFEIESLLTSNRLLSRDVAATASQLILLACSDAGTVDFKLLGSRLSIDSTELEAGINFPEKVGNE